MGKRATVTGNMVRVVKSGFGTAANITESLEVTSGTGLKALVKTSDKVEGWINDKFERSEKTSKFEYEIEDLEFEDELLEKKKVKLAKELELLEMQAKVDALKPKPSEPSEPAEPAELTEQTT